MLQAGEPAPPVPISTLPNTSSWLKERKHPLGHPRGVRARARGSQPPGSPLSPSPAPRCPLGDGGPGAVTQGIHSADPLLLTPSHPPPGDTEGRGGWEVGAGVRAWAMACEPSLRPVASSSSSSSSSRRGCRLTRLHPAVLQMPTSKALAVTTAPRAAGSRSGDGRGQMGAMGGGTHPAPHSAASHQHPGTGAPRTLTGLWDALELG